MKIFAGVAAVCLILMGLGLLVSDFLFGLATTALCGATLAFGWSLLPDGPLKPVSFDEDRFHAWVAAEDSFPGRFRRFRAG